MYTFKRGGTFSLAGTCELTDSLTGQSASVAGVLAACHLRDMNGTLIAPITVTLTPNPDPAKPAIVTLINASTDSWPLGDAQMDIRLQLATGDVIYTSTLAIHITERETRP